jgi:glycosyltransferase involved in cell wall biosynthesis
MANYWVARGQEVALITLASKETDFYPLHPEVKRIGLGLMAPSAHPWDTLRNTLHRLKRLRQELRSSRPDVVISFLDVMNMLTVLAAFGLGVPVIISERTNPRKSRIGWFRGMLRRLLYPRADAVIVLTEGIRRWAEQFVRRKAVYVIPNPVALPAHKFDRATYPLCTGRTIMAMGRLGPEKGFDLLIRAFGQCAAKYTDCSLVIAGEGREREQLMALVRKLGIAGRVSLPGLVKDPTELFLRADLFVLSSRYEGFPNALLEAMACGLPVISFDCSPGPREIIRDGVDGVLVPPEDVQALATAMGRLVSDEAERKRLASRAVEVAERFGVEKVMGMWEAFLEQVLRRRL